ncbi:hypothetical protein COK06_13150 [Bacillus cereus]|nr:hypothetical protein COK06_13150 [Bacillus cereus]
MAQSVQVYLGVPQIVKLPVFDVKTGNQVTINQLIFTNTSVEEAKITMTINTIDIIKDFVIPANTTKFIDVAIVLNQGDRLSLQQEKTNAINVMINGTSESVPVNASSNFQ